MKKRALALFLVLAMVCSMLPTMVFAAETSTTTQYATVTVNGTTYTGESDSLAELFADDGFPIKSTITTLTIGSGTFTGDDWETFDSMSNLKELIFSDAVVAESTTITNVNVDPDEGPSIMFPSSLTLFYMPQATEVGEYAFYDCTGLKTVHIPNVEKIGNGAFFGCSSLESITLPNVVDGIGQQAFYGCSSLVGVSIPNTTSLGISAFNDCSSLVLVDLPKVTYISSMAFSDCTNLKVVNAPSVTGISYINGSSADAFSSTTNVAVIVGSAYTSGDLSNATIVNIDDADTYSADTIAIVDGEVKSGDSWADIWDTYADEYTESNIDSIFIVKGDFEYNDWYAMYANGPSDRNSYALKASHFAISEKVVFSDGAKSLFAGDAYCGDYPTSNLADALVTFSVPQLTKLEDYALASAFNEETLKHVYLPNVETVGQYAFAANDSLTSIYLPSATSIGSDAFDGCSDLAIIDLPKATSVQTLSNLDALKVVSLPSLETTVEDAFSDNTALQVVNLSGATTLYENTFDGCSALNTVILGATVPTHNDELGTYSANLVLADGSDALTGSALDTAAAAYRADVVGYNEANNTWNSLTLLVPVPPRGQLDHRHSCCRGIRHLGKCPGGC